MICTVEPAAHLGDALRSDCGLTGTYLGGEHPADSVCCCRRFRRRNANALGAQF
jgi:hypothetical protein